MDSKEIEIFNVTEENVQRSHNGSDKNLMEYREFNSPTPDLSHSKLDITQGEFEIKTEDGRGNIINIDIDIKKPILNNKKILEVQNCSIIDLHSDRNNSLGSNEEEKSPPKLTQNVSTSPMPPKTLKSYKHIGISTKDGDGEIFELK